MDQYILWSTFCQMTKNSLLCILEHMKPDLHIPSASDFLSASRSHRLELIKPLLDHEDSHLLTGQLLHSIASYLEQIIADEKTSQTKRDILVKHLSDILTLQTYIPIRGSSLKMILEYLVYLL